MWKLHLILELAIDNRVSQEKIEFKKKCLESHKIWVGGGE